MPIYEYRCKECHQIFEEWSAHSGEASARPCPVCAEPAERLTAGPLVSAWPQEEPEQSCVFDAGACACVAFAGAATWRK